MQLKLLAAFSASFLVSKSAGVFVSSTFEVQPRLNRKVIKKIGERMNVCFKEIVRIYTNINMQLLVNLDPLEIIFNEAFSS